VTLTRAGTTLALLISLGAGAALLPAQADSPKTADAKKPAKRSTKQPATNKTAVRWNQDLIAARKQAAKGDQPLLVFQLLGDLDQEFC
jgi:hypothetical protein